ncbi:LamG-like jellyroll fold domain-containing protein [Cellvibrio japonicus]|uniref:Beta-xylosidase/alpha-L-arabinfuranosidase, putative, gly43E n=1 Tax=Cellvibrio japonicus (strain Ueda107) TaxID=498211 RepID=B3PKP2_CELJU|nr:LamG-like jellyroll fold domain-containing protein [Cellvibrio japonicus]ACE82940.1 beta-xylosidase/alpha-L-arabinfuranosidase, putative, gly43E [Cellvibrio japonicus Ueda107]QEI11452.1 family 43 glycosylhydrolase [Cellvibrio japonicus]QEI15026.1 family 43 glycosylhydrolase [Cellvibrio japonicus]QEI18606.1 family 43 glycosylhydrolase [Cellvibrio japonicus]
MKLTSLALAMSGLLILGGCGGSGDNKTYPSTPASEEPSYSKPSVSTSIPLTVEGSIDWQDIGVHDPSVVKAGSTYYIFGSHLAAAKSTDLINWEYISVLSANDRVDESPLFNTYSTEIAEGITWSDGYKGNWAADVIQAPNGKYWFYYNHCAQTEADGGCWNRSYLGLAEAESIEGPYVDKGVFLRSGYREAGEFSSYPLDNGQTTWNGAVDPNVIDPAAFYDKSGGLWMVYGSYSGGIFVLAMDENTGKPKAGQGFGKRLVGGDFRAIEGAFVMYSPVADYYYLFYSVAGFAANDGYNIRIARSKTPDGPYLDPAGNDIKDAAGLEIGGKLLGGFEFVQTLGEEGKSWGYQSPGHNSAYYDAATGRHILVTHTRFPATSTDYPNNEEAHAVRVHEMFVNKAGWLVASPQRYAPLEGQNVVDVNEIPGYYKFVNQGKAVNTAAIKSTYIALNTDRSVTGSESGNWAAQGGDAIKLELTSGVYFGVVKWQWDDNLKELVPVFSAMAAGGETVFGTRVDPITATSEALATVADALDVKTELTISDEGYSLPTAGKNGAAINWESSNEYYIGNNGNVFIPTPDLGNQTVTLTANITLNGQSTTKEFTVTLYARPVFRNAVAHYKFEDVLTDAMGNYASASATDNNLLNLGATSPAYSAGYAGQAFQFNGNNGVRLPDDIIKTSEYTVSFWMKAEALTAYTPAFFAATADNQWISFIPDSAAHFTTTSLVWSYIFQDGTVETDDWNQIVHTAKAPLNQWQHVAITYADATMKLYINGSYAGSMPRQDIFSAAGGGLFALGVNYGWDIPFKGQIDEFIVYDYALNSLDINGAAINNLTDPSLFAGFVKDALVLGDMSAVRENFELPRVGPFVSGISWASSNETFLKPVNGVAEVTQPSALQGDQVVTLTATITFEGQVQTKTFDVTVKSLAPAEYSFENDLLEAKGAYGAGKITGDRILGAGGSVTYVEGVKGSALSLDGTSGVRLPDNLITGNSYSIAMWLKPAAFTNFTTAFFGGASGTSWLSLVPSMNGSNKTRLWADKGGYFDKGELDMRIPQNAWTHIAITVDGDNSDTVKIYINGVLKLESTGFPRVFTVPGETNEFAIGVNYWDTPYNGAVDELKIFSGAITAESIGELYQEGSASVAQ